MNGTRWCVYGGPAYPFGAETQAGFRGRLTPSQQIFNTKMSADRIAVEWGFGRIVQLWRYVANRTAMKIYEAPIGMYIDNAALLTNLHTILYGGGPFYTHFDCHANFESMAAYLN